MKSKQPVSKTPYDGQGSQIWGEKKPVDALPQNLKPKEHTCQAGKFQGTMS